MDDDGTSRGTRRRSSARAIRYVSTPPGTAIRPARPADAGILSALALRSKAHWGYTGAMMEAFREELAVTPAYLDRHPAFVLECEGEIAGFCSLERLDGTRAELAFLFVDAPRIGRGLGRALIEHAVRVAQREGYRVLVIQGDPHAGRFYLAVGARRAGSRESASVPGRMLPVYEIPLGQARGRR